MEIVLNFDEKQVAVNEACNFQELNKKLKKLLGDDLPNWTIAGKDVKWVYQYWPTIIYREPYKLTWDYTVQSKGGPVGFTYNGVAYNDSIVCFSDNPEYAETEEK